MRACPRRTVLARRLVAGATGAVLLLSAAATAATAHATPTPPTEPAALRPSAQQAVPAGRADPRQAALDAVRKAGVHGVIAQGSDGRHTWRGASGVADVRTGRPMRPHFQHRIASITKTFTAVAVLQQVDAGRIELDAPVGRYLPGLVTGERGREITVRMLLDHTSGIADYLDRLFPSLETSLDSTVRNRFRSLRARELARIGLGEPAAGEPGGASHYANTNYVLAGLVLESVTGGSAEDYITRNVIRPAGLRGTYFPGEDPYIRGPHSKSYLTLGNGQTGEFSTYNMTWAYTAGALVSTADDVSRFGRALLGGRLLPAERLAELKTGALALDPWDIGPCTVWVTAGSAMGMETVLLVSDDGRRSFTYEANTTDQRPESDERIQPAVMDLFRTAGEQGLCG